MSMVNEIEIRVTGLCDAEAAIAIARKELLTPGRWKLSEVRVASGYPSTRTVVFSKNYDFKEGA